MTPASLLIRKARRLGATEHQVDELLAFLMKHAKDEAELRKFYDDSMPITAIRPWPHEGVPGILAACNGNTIVEIFLPAPRPVPKDPFFQHATPLTRADAWVWFAPFNAHYGMRSDWQWRDALAMDAPDTMPAGACQGFDYGDGVYGASQMTCRREG